MKIKPEDVAEAIQGLLFIGICLGLIFFLFSLGHYFLTK